MKLNFKKIGEGKPVLILHGLFGSLDNWITVAKKLAQNNIEVFCVDQRNHGHSPHSDVFGYQSMSDDLVEFINANNLHTASVIGHSMGGKTATLTALHHPEIISKLIVIDIAPRFYPVHHQQIIEALQSVDLIHSTSRNEIENFLMDKLNDKSTVQFLAKNIFRLHHHFAFRFNLDAIAKNIENVGEDITSPFPNNNPTLFIKGEKSNYISTDDEHDIKQLFLNAKIETAPNAGHWVHSDNPDWLVKRIAEFVL